jgi:small-conductance mechanosensitive channel/CRP-like cAMP-binding protein
MLGTGAAVNLDGAPERPASSAPRLVLPLLQSHGLIAACAGLVVLLIGLQALSGDPQFRRDLRGGASLLAGYLVLRTVDLYRGAQLPVGLHQVLELAWMLALTFGFIRLTVSILLKGARIRRQATPKILRDVLDGTLYLVATLIIVQREFRIDFSSLLAGSAIVSVVIGLALQETLGNLFAGLAIQLERPFQVGDTISVGNEIFGRIVQIGWRATRVENKRREVISLPNTTFSKQGVKNYTRGNEPVGFDTYVELTYDTPPNRVKAVIRETLAEVPLVLAEPTARIRTWAYEGSGIKYRIRCYVADVTRTNWARDEILTRLWYRLRREGIEVPFHQQVVHLRFPDQQIAEFGVAHRIALLDEVDLFRVLGPAERERVAHEMVARRFGHGERIIEQGAPGQTFYVVAAGSVSILTGRGVEVTRLGRGQYFGEMSLLTGEPRSATVVAAEDAVLFELDRPTFAQLFDEQPALAGLLSEALAHRRGQLRDVAEANGNVVKVREANWILDRLRSIFGLRA